MSLIAWSWIAFLTGVAGVISFGMNYGLGYDGPVPLIHQLSGCALVVGLVGFFVDHVTGGKIRL